VNSQGTSFLGKAKQAWANGEFPSFVEGIIGNLILWLLGWLCFICFITLPAQAIFETGYWFKYGELANFDWYDLLGHAHLDQYTSSDFAGLNKILIWGFDSWVSVFPCIAGLIIIVVVAVIGASK
jgi:hypothetical protein